MRTLQIAMNSRLRVNMRRKYRWHCAVIPDVSFNISNKPKCTHDSDPRITARLTACAGVLFGVIGVVVNYGVIAFVMALAQLRSSDASQSLLTVLLTVCARLRILTDLTVLYLNT